MNSSGAPPRQAQGAQHAPTQRGSGSGRGLDRVPRVLSGVLAADDPHPRDDEGATCRVDDESSPRTPRGRIWAKGCLGENAGAGAASRRRVQVKKWKGSKKGKKKKKRRTKVGGNVRRHRGENHWA